MLISGVQPFTMLDFPGRTSCIAWVPGCNFRCGYCHNPEFVLPELIAKIKDSFIPIEAFFSFLETRKGLLDGVTISGGEPTGMADLPDFLERIRQMGFQIKLDSNGGRPQKLKEIFDRNLVDYVAMDFKTAPNLYPSLVGRSGDPEKIVESMELIRQSGVDYEFRTTLVKEVHSEEVLKKMAEFLKPGEKLFLQKFRPKHTLDPEYAKRHSFGRKELTEISQKIFAPNGIKVDIRV